MARLARLLLAGVETLRPPFDGARRVSGVNRWGTDGKIRTRRRSEFFIGVTLALEAALGVEWRFHARVIRAALAEGLLKRLELSLVAKDSLVLNTGGGGSLLVEFVPLHLANIATPVGDLARDDMSR